MQCLISVSQTHYISDVVSCFDHSNSHPTSTPIAINFKLTILDSPEIDSCDYQSSIGNIMYTMLGMCPNIAYAVGALSQFLANLGRDHLTTINCLLQYLNSMKELKLLYDGNSGEHDFVTYSDSDCAGDPCAHCSFSGYVS